MVHWAFPSPRAAVGAVHVTSVRSQIRAWPSVAWLVCLLSYAPCLRAVGRFTPGIARRTRRPMSASRTSRSRIASRTSSQVDLRSQVERIAASLAIAVLHARVHNNTGYTRACVYCRQPCRIATVHFHGGVCTAGKFLALTLLACAWTVLCVVVAPVGWHLASLSLRPKGTRISGAAPSAQI